MDWPRLPEGRCRIFRKAPTPPFRVVLVIGSPVVFMGILPQIIEHILSVRDLCPLWDTPEGGDAGDEIEFLQARIFIFAASSWVLQPIGASDV